MGKFSIGNIAEKILAQEAKDIKEGKVVVNHVTNTVIKPDARALDVRKVKLEDSERNTILEEAFGVTRKEVKKQPKQEIKEEVDLKKLIFEFNDLVKRAKEILTEMTDCGALGVNMGGTSKKVTTQGIYDKKKDKYKRVLAKFKVKQ